MNNTDLTVINRLFGKQLDKKVFYTSVALALPFLLLGGLAVAYVRQFEAGNDIDC
jgi:hypothetical protein